MVILEPKNGAKQALLVKISFGNFSPIFALTGKKARKERLKFSYENFSKIFKLKFENF